jgi:hypothetical protein
MVRASLTTGRIRRVAPGQDVAQQATGDADKGRFGKGMFRALGRIRRLTLTNLGLSHAFGKNIRHTKFMGADIAEGLTDAQRLNRRKSDLFGLGCENDEKVTVGCSFKGRLWSHRVAYDLSEWVDWCHAVGKKLLDDTIDTNEVFTNVIKARRLSERPDLVPVMVSWPEEFQDQPEDIVEIEAGGFVEWDTEIENYAATGPLTFAVVSGSETGARRFRDTTFTIRADGSRHPPSRCWSRR